MPNSITSTTLYSFTAPAVDPNRYAIFGGVLPLPQNGLFGLGIAGFALIALALLHQRLRDRERNALALIGIVAVYLGTYVLSARWLDDVFINLIHPFHLFHFHRFSTLMASMNNGTVEIIYYALLTPFAGDRLTLIRADYVLGALIGAGHVAALAYLLRRVAFLPRLMALVVFAGWVPVVQSFSSGYGNGLVTLLYLLAVIALVENKTKRLAVLCALLPLIRPDALLYSLSLAAIYVLTTGKWSLRWWLPTLVAPVLYAGMIYLMYGQWVPTPILFKRVSVPELFEVLPTAITAFFAHFFASPERMLIGFFIGLYFTLPSRQSLPWNKRSVAAFLIATIPILLFFTITGQIGYNPTNYRYSCCFEIAYCFAGLFGLISLCEYLSASRPGDTDLRAGDTGTRPGADNTLMYFLASLPALFVLFQYAHVARSIESCEKGRWVGRDIGLEATFYDLERMNNLRFGGAYFGKIVPADWTIASTEMDTFGYFSGHEILDLWGFSNKRIAESEDRTSFGARRDTQLFQESNVPLLWLRTMSDSDEFYTLHDKLESFDPDIFSKGLWPFPNVSSRMMQTGALDVTLQKYDVVRVLHGADRLSILFVRRDLSQTFRTALIAGGAAPNGEVRIPLNTRVQTGRLR